MIHPGLVVNAFRELEELGEVPSPQAQPLPGASEHEGPVRPQVAFGVLAPVAPALATRHLGLGPTQGLGQPLERGAAERRPPLNVSVNMEVKHGGSVGFRSASAA